jgi:hypothetical protein
LGDVIIGGRVIESASVTRREAGFGARDDLISDPVARMAYNHKMVILQTA